MWMAINAISSFSSRESTGLLEWIADAYLALSSSSIRILMTACELTLIFIDYYS